MSTRLKIGQVVLFTALSVLLLSRPTFAETLYATSINTGQIFSVDTVTHAVAPVFNAGVPLDSIVFDPSGRLVYSQLNNGTVAAFNPNTHTNVNLATGLASPIDLALEPSLTSILVSDSSTNQLSRVSLAGGVVGSPLNLGGRPDGVIYDAAGDLFVNVSGGFTVNNSQVEEINPTTGAIIHSSGNTGVFLDGLTYDSFTGKLFATDYNNGRIAEIDPVTFAITFLTPTGVTIPGGGPDGVTSDGMGNLFLASRANGEVVEYNIATNAASNVATVDGLDDLAPASGLGSPVPEPSVLFMLSAGLLGLGGVVFGAKRL
jgi:sugar lactone lactonase YvrE